MTQNKFVDSTEQLKHGGDVYNLKKTLIRRITDFVDNELSLAGYQKLVAADAAEQAGYHRRG